MIWKVITAILGHAGKVSAAFCSCKSISAAEDQGVGIRLVAGGVFLVGAEWQHLSGCCALVVLHWAEQSEQEMHWTREYCQEHFQAHHLQAVTRAGQQKPPVSAQSRAGFPAAVRGTAGKESGSGSVPKLPAPPCQAGVSSQPTGFLNESRVPRVARNHLQQEGAEPATLIGTSPPSP